MGRADRERELKKLVAQLLALYAEGCNDDEAVVLMGLSPMRFMKIKKALYDFEAERLAATPTEHTYVEYVLNQIGCIKDLTDLLKEAKKQNNSNAGVGAIRARSDIYDKIIRTGQEFGILEKKPEEKRVIAGILVAQLSNDQLRQAITGAIGNLNEMVATFGDLDLTQLTAGKLHYELPESTGPAGKTNRARTSKVSKGRRVVKQPIV